VDEVLQDLQNHDLQSDERFTESFVHSRLRKGYGPVRIRQELSERGIGESVAEDALTRPADFWIEIAEQARRKRFGELPEAGDTDRWNTQARFLSRRGFPSDLIFTVLGARG
jgi:regulatory protein